MDTDEREAEQHSAGDYEAKARAKAERRRYNRENRAHDYGYDETPEQREARQAQMKARQAAEREQAAMSPDEVIFARNAAKLAPPIVSRPQMSEMDECDVCGLRRKVHSRADHDFDEPVYVETGPVQQAPEPVSESANLLVRERIVTEVPLSGPTFPVTVPQEQRDLIAGKRQPRTFTVGHTMSPQSGQLIKLDDDLVVSLDMVTAMLERANRVDGKTVLSTHVYVGNKPDPFVLAQPLDAVLATIANHADLLR